jgi:hypothetical protein
MADNKTLYGVRFEPHYEETEWVLDGSKPYTTVIKEEAEAEAKHFNKYFRKYNKKYRAIAEMYTGPADDNSRPTRQEGKA